MYIQVNGSIDGLERFDTNVCQFGNSGEEIAEYIYPNSKTVTKLVSEKESLKRNLNVLLNYIQPSYELIEPLLQIIINNMNKGTRIYSKIYEKMPEEAETVIEIYEQFDKVFENFSIQDYRNLLSRYSNLNNNQVA